MSPPPLRLRLFAALTGATLLGSLATGLYAVMVEREAIGFVARAWSVAPKALALAAAFVPLLLLAARWLGAALARPLEQVALAATRVAQGERAPRPASLAGEEARRIAEALGSLRRSLDRAPVSASLLRDGWHDLRNGLAGVRASLEILGDGGLGAEDVARFTANAARAAEALDVELEALVTLARFETAAIASPRPASLDAMVAAAVERSRALADATGVDLATTAAGPALRRRDDVLCDRRALERALENLIQNACAATPGGSVRVSCDSRASGALVVDVVNEPACVPRSVRPFLFERVSSGPLRSGSRTGLGLAIARAAIEAHGGRVSFREWGPPRVRVRVELPR